MRKIVLVVAVAVVGGLFTGIQAASAQGGGGCQLDGSASFKPGLTGTAADFTYNFSGTLGSCQSNEAGAPASGTVSAGQALVIKGEKFQEPVPTGNGSCENGTTSGTAIVVWDGGQYTVITYSTNSAAAGVVLQGSVAPSITLKAIHPKKGQPKSTTIKSTAYTGATGQSGGVVGLLTFQPDDPTACNGSGLTSAKIQGFTGLGSAQ